MSCNGCRVLRKGCSDSCILRHGLQWIEGADAQGHATLFIAKFFGRAGMLGLISSVSESQRPALFQSLLYEACGRTINPVHGAVGLLCSGNWQLCQAAVETVLSGGFLSTSSASSRSVARSPFMQMRVNDQVLDGEAERLPRVRIGRGFLPSSFEIKPSRSSAQEEAPDVKDAFFCRDKRKLDLFDLSINHPEVSKMKCSQYETSSDENSSHLKLDLTLGASNVSSVTFHKPFEAKIRCGSPSSSTTCAHS